MAPLKEVFWFMLKQIYTEGCRLPFKANFESRSLAGAHAHHVMISEMYYTEKCIASRNAVECIMYVRFDACTDF